MKLTRILASALLCSGALTLSAAGSNPSAAAAAPAAASPVLAPQSIEAQLQPIFAKIKTKLDDGADTKAALSDELKQFDAVIAAHRQNPAEAEGVAKAIYVEATLYWKVLQDYDKAGELLTTVKNDFPRSRAYFAATELLDQIDLQRESFRIQNALAVGSTFPDFNVIDTKGNPLSVSKYKGKVVLIDFWATWCGPCVRELPNVLAAYTKFHPKGFEIIGVSLDNDTDKVTAFTAEKQMTWPQFSDGKGWENSVSKKYGITSIPMTYLVGRDGKIVAKNLRGPALEEELARQLK